MQPDARTFPVKFTDKNRQQTLRLAHNFMGYFLEVMHLTYMYVPGKWKIFEQPISMRFPLKVSVSIAVTTGDVLTVE